MAVQDVQAHLKEGRAVNVRGKLAVQGQVDRPVRVARDNAAAAEAMGQRLTIPHEHIGAGPVMQGARPPKSLVIFDHGSQAAS